MFAPLARAFSLNWANCLRAGLLLGPSGEFAFVIVAVAITEHLMAAELAQVVLFVTTLTMATIPLMSRLGDRLAPRLASKARSIQVRWCPKPQIHSRGVIIAGFGRVGQTVAAGADRGAYLYDGLAQIKAN